MSTIKLAIFASGNGTNALNLISHFKDHSQFEVAFVLVNKKDAPIIHLAQKENVEVILCTNNQVDELGFLLNLCKTRAISAIILAGFLRKIPIDLVNYYSDKIINIHPALLPKFGGVGMYGKYVHQAVLAAQEKETGITIHLVNDEYDRGEILAQFSCQLNANDDVESIQRKIHQLEMQHFPLVVEQVLTLNN